MSISADGTLYPSKYTWVHSTLVAPTIPFASISACNQYVTVLCLSHGLILVFRDIVLESRHQGADGCLGTTETGSQSEGQVAGVLSVLGVQSPEKYMSMA